MGKERLFGLTESQMLAVRETVRHYVNLFGGGKRGGRNNQVQRTIQVKLREDLLAAVDSWTDPSTATATVFEKYGGGNDMRPRTLNPIITIVNRFENISVEAGTYCKAEWIDGEWQLYAADCPGTLSASSFAPSVSTSPSLTPSVGGI